MNLTQLNRCPGTLVEGYDTYSATCLKYLFAGRKVSHILPYDVVQQDEKVAALFLENRKRISISGVQEKLSLIRVKNKLRLTVAGEQGTYILKPIPRDLKHVDQVPANEHLTMQIAKQVYNIRVAENALIFFKNGTPAYLTKRFDIAADGNKLGIEDFATLAGKTKATGGSDYKYQGSYEKIGELIRQYIPAWRVEIEKFFSLVLFNYLFSNGDAHLKNFSVLETSTGDYLLSPAYDLINTRIHVNDTDFALDQGLFSDNYQSFAWKKNGHPGKADLKEFAKRIGVLESRVDKLMQPFLIPQEAVKTLIERSFLNRSCKKGYLMGYNRQRNYLNG